MRIGILGSGNIGGTAARLFSQAGHEVALSHAGPKELLEDKVAELGPRARAATIDEAADFGEVVLLAIPWRSRQDLPAERLRGRIVLDAMNHYLPDYSLSDLGESTSSEEVAKVLPGARLVKALNHLYARDLASRGFASLVARQRTALFLAGDDPEAKQVVARLVEEIGFAPVDTGSLREGGRLQQAGGPLYTRVMTGEEAEAVLRAGQAQHQGAAEQP